MSSAGDTGIEAQLRVVRTVMDALGLTLDEALERHVPAEQHQLVRQRWENEHVPLLPADVLRSRTPPTWFSEWDPAQGYYWRRLRDYLIDRKGRSETVVQSLDDTTDGILKSLGDPREGGPPFQVRGLVVGYVQSGKTANFSALTAKAADAGYRIVIVLSGIHKSLRRQTQIRLDEELGVHGDSGVGRPETGREWVSVTGPGTDEDFRRGTINNSMLQGNERVIMVVKKNASVLRRLAEWLEDRPTLQSPVLVIDDEADQASINTRGNRRPLEEVTDIPADEVDDVDTDTDPSVINGLVRRLLTHMERVAYIGYTATPFANVLINHEAVDREVMDDLYPRDFIVSLPRPTGYVGAERLFGREALTGETTGDVDGVDVVRRVEDWEAAVLTPSGGTGGATPTALPPSLRAALLDFMLSLAARDLRAGPDVPAAMLVHTSPYVHQQDAIGELLRAELTDLRQRWRYDRTSIEPELRRRWDNFRQVATSLDPDRVIDFDNLADAVTRVVRAGLPVLVMHNKSGDTLDYELDPGLRAVVVGGNKLSRGLTLEGLLVSYYVRSTNYFDTLLQMGRWFGYRETYLDLTRLWTTDDLADRFRDMATAEEDLRADIRLYERLQATPEEFGPRIRSHPVMQITARNRMGSAQPVNYDFSGQLSQATKYKLDDRAWLEGNLDATRSFLSRLGAPDPVSVDGGQPTWAGVDWQAVLAFLDDYRTHPDAPKLSARLLRDYIDAQAHAGELVRWHVSVRGLTKETEQLGTEDLQITGRVRVNAIGRSRERDSRTSIKALINPVTLGDGQRGDQIVGLSQQQLDRAKALTSGGMSVSTALERVRDKQEGLLLLYPISRYAKASPPAEGKTQQRADLFDDPERDGVTVIGLAVALPHSDSEATKRYIVGSAGAAT